MLLADHITNLTAARYFAARGADFLFFDPADGLQPAQMRAIRDWVEGPLFGLYLPLGQPEPYLEHLAALQPEALLIGTFGKAGDAPSNYILFKEWHLQEEHDLAELPAHLSEWPSDTHHLLRLQHSRISPATLLGSPLARLTSHHRLILELPLQDWPPIWQRDLTMGMCLQAPGEDQVGLLSFDELDLLLDALDEHRQDE